MEMSLNVEIIKNAGLDALEVIPNGVEVRMPFSPDLGQKVHTNSAPQR